MIPPQDDEIRAEIEFHLAARAESLMAEGWAEEDAWREARRRFGNRERVRTDMEREIQLGRWLMGWRRIMDGLAMDLRVGLRRWRRDPVTAVLAVLTLALGIGASTAIFSLVYGVLLRPLPYTEPDELAALWVDVTERGGPDREWFSFANLHDIREQVSGFQEVGVYSGWGPVLTGRGSPVQLAGAAISAGFLDEVLGVEPARGRFFTDAEDVADGPAVVVVSHPFWRETLGAPASLDGVDLTLSGLTFRVIGVLPEGFRSPVQGGSDVWRPIQVDPVAVADLRGNFSWRAIARLAPGVPLDRARSELAALAARLQVTYPESNTGMAFTATDLRSDLVANARTGLLLLLGMVGLVLLMASVNVANLLVARNSRRQATFAIRAALGSGRGRQLRQLFVETLIPALAGGALGLLLAAWGTGILVALAPAGTPRLDAVETDLRVLLAGLSVTAAVALFTGLLPGLGAARTDLRSALATQNRGGSGSAGSRLRQGLVVVQVSLAVALLTTASLLARSLTQLQTVDLGYEPESVTTFFLGLPGEAYQDRQARAAFLTELEPRLAALPGVEAAGSVSSLPLAGFDEDTDFNVDGRPPPEPGEPRAAWVRRITPGYTRAMGLTLVTGRAIDERDQAGTPRVVLVNETLAERYFPGANPVGQRLDFGAPGNPLPFEIVGVVRNVRQFGVRDDWRSAVYLANAQFPAFSSFFTLKVAPGLEPTSVIPAARAAVAELDPGLAVTGVQTMQALVDERLGSERFLAWLLGGFAALALLLASIGLYGVVNHAVTSRLREVAVRVAMGAGASEIRRRVVARSLGPVASGLVVGAVVAWFAARAAESVLYGVSPADPVSFAVTAAILMIVAVAAATGPAIRASRVPPMRILRDE